jgi:hypothetical protein
MNMKRSLLICAAALMMLVSIPKADADQIRLTLDLRNTNRANAASGGTWQLFARKVETGSAPEGNSGISGIRAILNGISSTGITFASGINQLPTGGPYIDVLTNNAVEIVYGQDISTAGVVNNVGIGANANQDRLIASGTWPAGATRPTFGTDPAGAGSEGNFLGGSSAPYPASLEVSGANVTTQVVTLGDINGSNTITAADTPQYLAVLGGSVAYNPAADINQSGSVTAADTAQYLAILGGPSSAAISVVPEPSSIGLAVIASMGLLARRRRV